MLKEIEKYFKYIHEYGYSSHTIKIKVQSLKKLNCFMDKQNISGFNDFKCRESELFKEYLVKINLGKTTITSYLKGTREFFNYLVSLKIIKTNPFLKAKNKSTYPEEFKKYFAEYIRIKENELAPKGSLKRIKASINILFSYLMDIGIIRLNEITKNDIKLLISHMIDKLDSNGNKVYKPVSINRILFDIKNFFLFLKERGMSQDVSSSIAYLRQGEKLSRNILTKKEIANLFKIEPDDLYQFMIKTVFICLYSTGLRVGELLKLRINDIDYENRVLIIYESKTRKERYVHIGDIGINYLKIYLKHTREKIGYDPDKSDLVFISNIQDSELTLETINKHLKLFCRKAGITKSISSHCFRHSYGSHLLENGADIKIISELLGHAQISSTERYTRLGTESLRKIVNTFHPREQEDNKWN